MVYTKAKIISNTLLKNKIYELVLRIDKLPEINCGQFVMLDCGSNDGITLKRPISIHSFDEQTITLLYQAIGKGTTALSKQKHGELDIILPLGNGFDVKNYKKIALVGGGLGIFPLYSVIKKHPNIEYYAYLGCRDADAFVCEEKFLSKCKNTIIATDDGSKGCQGQALDFIKKDMQLFDAVFACGSKAMLKALKDIVKDTQTPIFISLEERMGCGFGACLVCTCKTNEGNKKVCSDGPVFNIKEVIL